MFIDTHCHLNMIGKNTFEIPLSSHDYEPIEDALNQASNAGVHRIINVGTSMIESANCVEISQRYEQCYAAVGIHPNDAQAHWKEQMNLMKSLWLNAAAHHKIVAIGEVGLDYHYQGYNKELQHEVFCFSIELALEYNLPVIIHTRNAAQDTLRVLERYASEPLRGVVHCFSEDYDFAQRVIQQGLMLGIGGTLTYPKNNYLREVCKKIDLSNIVLETDAPFLPVQSMRGKKNYPQYIPLIADYLAQIRECDLDLIQSVTQHNAERLFKF